MKKLAINGFGRIGRTIARANQIQKKFELVGINDVNPHIENMAYLLKYDSTYGPFPANVKTGNDSFIIDDKSVKYFYEDDISNVPWADVSADIVIDSSGVSHNILSAKELVKNSNVSKVVVTHSSQDVDKEIIMGVNDNLLDKNHHVVSNSICDANAIAHVMKWLNDAFGIDSGSITTLHPWLSYQNIVDGPAISQQNPGVVWKDYALGRASCSSVIPKNTTAMTAVEKVIPELKGKILSFSYRIPTDVVASSDLTVRLKETVSQQELVSFIQEKIRTSPYVQGNDESLVSLDYKMNSYSAIIDMQWLKVQGNLVKLILWYDNEYGYSSRVLDLALKLLEE